MPSREKTRECARCGVEIDGRRGRKYCEDCAPIAKREKETARRYELESMRRNGEPKRCVCCGRELSFKGAKKYCLRCAFEKYGKNHRKSWEVEPVCGVVDGAAVVSGDTACRETDVDGRARLVPTADEGRYRLGVIERERQRQGRRLQISGEEINRLAQLYGPPYDSYGKMRAYIDTYDRLPPESCLRAAHPNQVDPYAWQELEALPRLRTRRRPERRRGGTLAEFPDARVK